MNDEPPELLFHHDSLAADKQRCLADRQREVIERRRSLVGLACIIVDPVSRV